MKKLVRWMLAAGVAFTFGASLQAQQTGTETGGIDFSTNAFGGQIGQEQTGNFGSFGNGDQWIGIGQPTAFPNGPLINAYGMRMQWLREAATVSLNGAGSNKNLEIQWGGNNSNGQLNFNYLNNLTNPSAKTFIATMTRRARMGVGRTTPLQKLDVLSSGSESNFAAVAGENQRDGTAGGQFKGTNFGVILEATPVPGTTASPPLYASLGEAVNPGGEAYGSLRGVEGSDDSYGYFTKTFSQDRDAYGVFAYAEASAGTAYSIFGLQGNGGSGAFAGFFDGDVTVTGTFSNPSDKKFKDNIEAEVSAMDKIMQLRPTTYTFRNDEFDYMNFKEGTSHGFIAQELETVFPEMVNTQTHRIPVPGDITMPDLNNAQVLENQYKDIEFKSINYMEMIPVLTAALQEQQTEMAALEEKHQAELDALKQELQALKAERNGTQAAGLGLTAEVSTLAQNAPNPFSQTTEINFYLAEGTADAHLYIYNLQGQQIRDFDNLAPGEGRVVINGAELEAGMYLYSLIVEGKEVATKRMILTK